MIKRHNKSAICMHWFNAVCWLLLLGSGFALLTNPEIRPLGSWWPVLWESIFHAPGILYFHILLGLVWCGIYAAYLLCFFKQDALPFLKEIFTLSPYSDLVWCIRKGLWLTIGPKTMRRLGLDPELPPQGFYNAGQKLVAIAAVLCSIILVGTGLLLLFSSRMTDSQTATQWALLIHLCCACLMAILLPVHIYMAAMAPGERPALISMFTGTVPEEFAKDHNPLWFAKLEQEKTSNPEYLKAQPKT